MNTDLLRRFQKRFTIISITVAASFCAFAQGQAPRFDAVYKLLQENATGLTSEQLNAAAVRGLLSELEDQALLVTNAQAKVPSATNLLVRTSTFDKYYQYLRIGEVGAGMDGKVTEQLKQLTGTNKIAGVILDLRFAEGIDYAAAAKTADLFLSSEQPLINWGSGSATATTKATAISAPVAILINSRTRGAAEALAAVLREAKVGLLIGGTSAGQASIFKEYPLEGGHVLRIASAPVKVGQDKVLTSGGLKPDIELEVSLENEHSYLEDPYRMLTRPVSQISMSLSTNALTAVDTNKPRSRINEAELVRRKREGLSTDEEFLDQPLTGANELRVIRDPSLARALDLLKGLALIRGDKKN